MHRRTVIGTIAGLSLGLAIITTAIPAFASGQGHGIAGTITTVSSTSMQVQIAAGPVTERLTSSTRVMKLTRGSLSDLAPGTFASVTVASGTDTITVIHLASNGAAASHPRTGTHPAHPIYGSNGGTTSKPKAELQRGGQIVSAANGELTLRNRQGQTTTYKLGPTVSVTKTAPGQLSDLTIGETVRIVAIPGTTTAVAVIIESA